MKSETIGVGSTCNKTADPEVGTKAMVATSWLVGWPAGWAGWLAGWLIGWLVRLFLVDGQVFSVFKLT
jgi:hypothetical protein